MSIQYALIQFFPPSNFVDNTLQESQAYLSRRCNSVPVLCCFGVVIEDSQLLLQLGSFAEGVQVPGPTQGVARRGKMISLV